MKRRELFLGALALGVTAALPLRAEQRRHFANGELTSDGFDWNVGGGDPLQANLVADHFRQALQVEGLNFTPSSQEQLRARLAEEPTERISLAMYEGQRLWLAVMMSGDGWLAFNPRINTHLWPRRQFGASVWFVTTDQGRFQVIVPDICNNLLLVPRGNPLPCVCVPARDACV